MKKIAVFLLFLITVAKYNAYAQLGCSTLGQTPATAFPLCTKDVFEQSTVPTCVNKTVLVPGCSANGASYQDKNPFWYRFTCYQTGTQALLITPNNLADDYDWQLYDITGITDLNSVYTNSSLFVVGNWSGSSGLTGAGPSGTNKVECGSDPADNINTFSAMPILQNEHTYLLMVSHFSDNQSGYKISFDGGTAVINDPKLPDLQKLQTSCDATVISLKLETKMKCNSLATDGSDFIITPANAAVIGATGNGCSSSFDMDSITLILSNALPPGDYNLSIKQGTDVNTLLDDCDRDIPVGHKLSFKIEPLQPTPLDSISPVKCAPSQLELVFRKNIRCNSIAADGSDFVISGPAPVTIASAAGVCNNGVSSTILIKLAAPVVVGGVYQVTLKTGSDLNNIIDECGQETPAGESVSFTVKDTVSADFSFKLNLGCKADTIVFLHDGSHQVNQWFWIFDAAGPGNQQTQTVIFKTFGTKQILLKVSNGFCTDSISETVTLDNELKAGFETSDLLCPEDAAVFKNTSVGKTIVGFNWIFGNGNTSTQETPEAQKYPVIGDEKTYNVQLIAQNAAHCFDTAVNSIKVLRTCYIAVPNAFTPNGDQHNDYLYPLNAYKADNLEFNVYNRLGQLVFHTTDWTKKWDGTISGHLQSSGNYVWTLRYINHDTGKKVFLKGTSVLIR